MPLHDLWTLYRSGGYPAVRRMSPPDAPGCFYLALLAFGEDDFAHAAALAHRAADLEPDHPVWTAAAVYLDRVVAHGKTGVYVDGGAFAAFIRGGGNVGLYAAVSKTLRDLYREYTALRLFDVGVGDGMALLPALTENIARLDLLEPSAAMLKITTAALDARSIPYHAANTTLQEYRTEADQTWDVVQATFSLQSIPPDERPGVFRWMRAHTDCLLLAEFDVPEFTENFAPERVEYIVERYARGLAEYAGDGGLVAQGFLMPVMFGYFDDTAARTNWEGPIAGWVEQLHAAGFENVQTQKLFPYFWADAYLTTAS